MKKIKIKMNHQQKIKFVLAVMDEIYEDKKHLYNPIQFLLFKERVERIVSEKRLIVGDSSEGEKRERNRSATNIKAREMSKAYKVSNQRRYILKNKSRTELRLFSKKMMNIFQEEQGNNPT